MGKPKKSSTPKQKRKYTRKAAKVKDIDKEAGKIIDYGSDTPKIIELATNTIKTGKETFSKLAEATKIAANPPMMNPALERLRAFMEAWKAGDWKAMTDCCQLTWLETGHPCCTPEGWLEIQYGMMNIKSYKIDPEPEKVREWEYMLAFNVKADIENRHGLKAGIKINIVFETIPQEPEKDMSAEHGEWGVNPISALNITWS